MKAGVKISGFFMHAQQIKLVGGKATLPVN